LSEKRILFKRDLSYLPKLKAGQKPGHCAQCGNPLPKARKIWCSEKCYGIAYDASIIYDWQKTRDEVLKRDDLTCQKCGRRGLSASRDFTHPALRAEVDHIVPIADDADPAKQFDRENLQTLCHNCHVKVTQERRLEKAAPAEVESVKREVGAEVTDTTVPDRKLTNEQYNTIEKLLLENWSIADTSAATVENPQAVLGVWAALKIKKKVRKEDKPGTIQGKPPRIKVPPPEGVAPIQPSYPPPNMQQSPQVNPNTGFSPAAPPSGQPMGSFQQFQPQSAVPASGMSQSYGPSWNPQGLQGYPPSVGPVGPGPRAGNNVLTPVSSPEGLIMRQQLNQPDRGLSTTPAGLTIQQIPEREQNGNSQVIQDRMMIDATPIVMKVINNARNLLWFDWFRKRYNYTGDMGDFITDCIDDFFKSRGWEIIVSKKEPVSN